MDGFESLNAALEGWFEADLSALPGPLQERVRHDFVPLSWEMLTADQRRIRAAQWDQAHDPALEPERQKAWDLVCEIADIEDQIERWQSVSAPTASDLEIKEAKLLELRRALGRAEAQMRVGTSVGPVPAARRDRRSRTAEKGLRFIAYPAALARLRARLNATPEELAAWIWAGPQDGGLAAYVNANELDPPPRFHFPDGGMVRAGEGHDYLAPMMACWFREDEIEKFDPPERYIVGRDLIARWSKVPGIDPVGFIRAKIRESRLLDAHPIYGLTRGTLPEEEDFPPIELGLHRVSEIEAIESEDFGSAAPRGVLPESGAERRLRVRQRVEALRAAGVRGFLKAVAEEEGLSVSRIKQLFANPRAKARNKEPASWIAPVSQRDRTGSGKRKG